jgi:hypothetical protein
MGPGHVPYTDGGRRFVMEGHAPSWPRLAHAVCTGPDATERVLPGPRCNAPRWIAAPSNGGPRSVDLATCGLCSRRRSARLPGHNLQFTISAFAIPQAEMPVPAQQYGPPPLSCSFLMPRAGAGCRALQRICGVKRAAEGVVVNAGVWPMPHASNGMRDERGRRLCATAPRLVLERCHYRPRCLRFSVGRPT